MLIASSDVVSTGSLLLAVPLAVAAGLVSFLSPCCLPLVPGYLSYVTGAAGAEVSAAVPDSPTDGGLRLRSRRRLGGVSRTGLGAALFVLGFSLVFTSYGAAFGGLGRTLLGHQRGLVQVLGLVTVLMGLSFLGAFDRFAAANRTWRLPLRPSVGLAGAPLLGVLFGIGWTPCIGPTLAAVLTLSVGTGSANRGALLAFSYSLGLGLPFLLAAISFRRALTVLPRLRRHSRRVMRAGGLLLVAVGLLQLTGAWGDLVARLQTVISGFQPVL